jgi:O-antigen/teichoic acid export membrane protein
MPLTAVVWPMSGSVTSAMCRVQNNGDRLRTIYGSALSIGMWAGCGAATISFVYSEPIVLLIYGDAWGHVVPIFRALALSILVQPLYTSIGWVAIAMGYTKRKFYAGLFAACIYALGFRIGVEHGAIGVAYAYCIALIFIVPAWTYVLTKGSPVTMAFVSRISVGPIVTGIITTMAVSATFPNADSLSHAGSALLLILLLAGGGYLLTTYRTPWCVSNAAKMLKNRSDMPTP